jgi:hypothetical protein
MGYLFVCPEEDLQIGTSSFKWPDCPAYWSLDPSGAERFSTEDATTLGFPILQFSIQVRGHSWDASVYAGLHQFYGAKGFDPDSQDVARYLGCPLYYLPTELDLSFAHGAFSTQMIGSMLKKYTVDEAENCAEDGQGDGSESEDEASRENHGK